MKGQFDLRNAVMIKQSTSAPDAIEIHVAERDASRPPAKKLIISFVMDNEDAPNWLCLWCSAIATKYVASSLQASIDPALAKQFNVVHASQPARSANFLHLPKSWGTTKILSPRDNCSSSFEELDTPRAAAQAPDVTEPPASTTKHNAMLAKPPSPDVQSHDVTFEVTVPDGVKPGDKLQATTPAGVKVKLVVPEKAEPGMSLTFTLPNDQSPKDEWAAVAIQARVRGRKGRQAISGKKDERMLSPARANMFVADDQQKAAVALQSSFRGHTVRNEQQERSRLQWMDYYKQPHVADFDKALDLAVTADEENAIFTAQKVWASEEARRIKWFKHFLETSNLKEAARLVVTPLEEAKLIKAQLQAPFGPCACVLDYRANVDGRRKGKFESAIKTYDWIIAEMLAATDEEMQDLDDSKLRVDLMTAAKLLGDFEKAQAYAITEAEREDIEAHRDMVETSVGQATAELNAAAAKMQARVRGGAVRGQHEREKMEHAAVLLQKSYRGHSERDNQEEQRRLTWLQWHLEQREFGSALDLAISKDERKTILETKSKVENGKFCRCCNQRPQGRKEKFVSAIRNYDWDQAQLLAVGSDERQDLEDSRNRVAWMLHYTAKGNYDEALALAITDDEKSEIESK